MRSGATNIDLLLLVFSLGSAIVSGFLILVFLLFFFFFFFSASGFLPFGVFLLRRGLGLLPVTKFLRREVDKLCKEIPE